MTAENLAPADRAADYAIAEETIGFNPTLLNGGGSVRELERLAGALRHTGDVHSTERVDQTILSLLEKKIYRKIMAQSRRQGRP